MTLFLQKVLYSVAQQGLAHLAEDVRRMDYSSRRHTPAFILPLNCPQSSSSVRKLDLGVGG